LQITIKKSEHLIENNVNFLKMFLILGNENKLHGFHQIKVKYSNSTGIETKLKLITQEVG
jgi:hypothetical protein